MRIFGEFTKIEDQPDGTIKVFGVASSGARDEAGEIVQPDAMKAALPDYAKYPALREMHQASAAGTMLEASVDDNGITRVVGHVVDPLAIAKVKSQTYRGFSIGGRVLKRDATDPTVITAIKLSEISLVDRPCNPEASIDLWKADIGENAPMAYAPTNDEVKARAAEMAKAAGKTAMDAFKGYVVQAREALIAEHVEPEQPEAPVYDPAVVEAVDKAAGGLAETDHAEVLAKVAAAVEGGEDVAEAVTKAIAEHEAAREPAEPEDPQAVLAAAVEKAKASDKPYGDVEYADPKNSKYPIDTAKHIRAAWSYINMPKNQEGYTAAEVDAIKAKIVAAWKDKIDADGPPSAEKMLALADLEKVAAALRLLAKASDGKLLKGLYSVERLALLIEQLTWLQQDVAWEEGAERDDSTMPADLAGHVAALLTCLAEMVAEEAAEILDAYNSQGLDIDLDGGGDAAIIEAASSILDLAKADEALMQKVGARNSKADQANIQAAHDAMAKLGAMCDPSNVPADEADKAAKAADLAKTAAELLTSQSDDLAELRKHAAGEAERTQAAIAEALEKFRAEPLPPKTAASTHARAVGKAEDSTPGAAAGVDDATKAELTAWWAGLTPEQRTVEAMKSAFRSPVQAR